MKNRKNIADTLRQSVLGRNLVVGELEDNAPADNTGFAGFTIKDEDGKSWIVQVYDGEQGSTAGEQTSSQRSPQTA